MRNNLIAISFFFLGIFGVVFDYAYNGLPGDLGDARFNAYVLEHFYLALTGKVDGFVDAGFFYPFSKVMMFSDNHWGTGLIYAYFRSFDSVQTEAFLSWFLVGFILNYWSAFYVLRKFELSQFAAGIAAFLFTFGLPIIAQDGHAQLLYRPFVPLAFFGFYNYCLSRNFYHLSLTVLAISSQFLISVYTGMFLVYFILMWFVVEIWFTSKGKIKDFLPHDFCLRKSLPILGISSLLLLLFAVPYLQVKNLYHFSRPFWEINTMLPRIQSYFLADHSNIWFKDLRVFSLVPSLSRHEHQMFIGVGALMALSFLFLRKGLIEQKTLAKNMSLSLVLMIGLTLSLGVFTIYPVMMIIPGASSLRSVSREILIMIFPLSYLVGFAIDRMRDTDFKTISSSAVIAVICFLVVVDPIFAEKRISAAKTWDDRIEKLQSKIDVELDKDSILLFSSHSVFDEIDAMILSQKLGIKTINGYSGHYPAAWYSMTDCSKARARIDSIEDRMISIDHNFVLDRNKVITIGFSTKCDFTKNNSKE